jgi:glutamate:GABA antiporter
MNKNRSISLFTLIMLITVSIDSIRNLPMTAKFGGEMFFFFIIATATFLIPTGLISAELTATHTKNSGIYSWVKKAFGQHAGFFAIWLQWVNTLVWYPTTLSFIASTLLYTLCDALHLNHAIATNHLLLTVIIAATFWIITLYNLKGFQASARFASTLAILGMIIPMVVIIALAAIWLAQPHHSSHLNLSWHNAIPNLSQAHSWTTLVAIITSFLGMELASVHVKNINQPERKFPRAIILSATLILITMLLGACALAITMPQQKLSLVAGIMQEIHFTLTQIHLAHALQLPIEAIMALLIILGGLASMINWIISPAEGLLQAGQDGYLPQALAKRNSNGVASRILILQAVLVTLTASVFQLLPDVNHAYWLLTSLSTELYVSMYVLMFLAALTLFVKTRTISPMLKRLGGKWMLIFLCTMGLCGCLITLYVGFIPPLNMNFTSSLRYAGMFTCGLITMILPVLLGYGYKKHQSR